MSFSGTVDVSTTAIKILSVNTGTTTLFKNNGPEAVYIGAANVTADETSTGGWKLEPKDEAVQLGGDVWGVTARGNANVAWIQTA
jgi:hypothetical protein